jgi:hypothetical protein
MTQYVADQYMAGRKKYQRPQAMLWADNPGTLSNGVFVPEGFEVGANIVDASSPLFDQFLILSDDNREPLDFSIQRIENRERMINGRMRSYHVADKLSLSVSWRMLPSRSFATVPAFSLDGKPVNVVTVGYNSGSNLPESTITPVYINGEVVANPLITIDADGNSDTTYDRKTIHQHSVTNPKIRVGANKVLSVDPDGPAATHQSQQYTTDGGAGGAEILKWYENHTGSFWVYLAYDKYTNFGADALAYTHLPQYNQVIEMFVADFSYSVQKRGGSNYDFWDVTVKLEEV